MSSATRFYNLRERQTVAYYLNISNYRSAVLLQSDNGKEFINKVKSELARLSLELKLCTENLGTVNARTTLNATFEKLRI